MVDACLILRANCRYIVNFHTQPTHEMSVFCWPVVTTNSIRCQKIDRNHQWHFISVTNDINWSETLAVLAPLMPLDVHVCVTSPTPLALVGWDFLGRVRENVCVKGNAGGGRSQSVWVWQIQCVSDTKPHFRLRPIYGVLNMQCCTN